MARAWGACTAGAATASQSRLQEHPASHPTVPPSRKARAVGKDPPHLKAEQIAESRDSGPHHCTRCEARRQPSITPARQPQREEGAHLLPHYQISSGLLCSNRKKWTRATCRQMQDHIRECLQVLERFEHPLTSFKCFLFLYTASTYKGFLREAGKAQRETPPCLKGPVVLHGLRLFGFESDASTSIEHFYTRTAPWV